MNHALGLAIVLVFLGDLAAKQSATPATAERSACPDDMIEVDGDYCPAVEQYCAQYTDAKEMARDRCAEFKPTGRCFGKTMHKRFCVDRYEWPNRYAVKPDVAVTWDEAKVKCEAIGKRLCEDKEWTLACEGQERLPYPYGLSRDATACNIDKAPINPHEEDLRNFTRRDAEAKRLWQGEPSGSRDRCKSAFGVQDMTGNVDEWVINEKGKPHHSGLKGGYWSWVRGRCRPLTDGHAEDFRYYQIGFRCCSDAPAGGTSASR